MIEKCLTRIYSFSCDPVMPPSHWYINRCNTDHDPAAELKCQILSCAPQSLPSPHSSSHFISAALAPRRSPSRLDHPNGLLLGTSSIFPRVSGGKSTWNGARNMVGCEIIRIALLTGFRLRCHPLECSWDPDYCTELGRGGERPPRQAFRNILGQVSGLGSHWGYLK